MRKLSEQAKKAHALMKESEGSISKKDTLFREGEAYRLKVDLTGVDPFNPYAQKKILDDTIYSYVDSYKRDMVGVGNVEIEFLVNKKEEEDDHLIEEAFRRHYRMELAKNQRDRRRKRILAYLFLAFGAILVGLSLWMGLSDYGIVDDIVGEIVSIAAWVFVWTAVELLFFDLRDLKIEAFQNALMSLTDITFVEGGNEDARSRRS